MINEKQLETLCLEWFNDINWQIAYGPDIAPDGNMPERNSYNEVLLVRRLEEALIRLNPHLPHKAIEQVINRVTIQENLDLRQNNLAFHRLLLNGVPVEIQQQDELVRDHAFLIDFNNYENNHFFVVKQFTVKGPNGVRRPDMVCFINGLPIALIELKNPTEEQTDIWDAYNQLQNYKEEIPELLTYNEALIISDGISAKIGSLTSSEERFLPWKAIKNENDKPLLQWELETLVKGFFEKKLLLEYLRYFILFENNDSQLIKKIAGYHQFHGVRTAVMTTIIAAKQPDKIIVEGQNVTYGLGMETGSKKAGVVWHTQGSGKSISMCCYAGMLLQQPEMRNPTLVIVTDRNDLDGQLFQTFSYSQELLKQTPVQAEDRDELRSLLSERESGGIIFTTVQKFTLLEDEKDHPILNSRHNIVVISDEAHRSQYGIGGKFNPLTGTYRYGYARNMRNALPNASFIGFTGTPISYEDRDTRAVFGEYVSIYDVRDAVEDGATIPIYYESRLAKLDINQAEIEALSVEVEEIVEDEEDLAIRERTKGEWTRLEKLVGAFPRIKQVAEDLVNHFEARLSVMDGKGMIVGMSREICVHLYDAIKAIRPEWHNPNPEAGTIKVIMTGSASDKELLRPHIYNKQAKKRIEKRFKDPQDSLKLVIVRDMWLTGFDVPCCHTIYIDKPMKGHNLMQAIARVNRIYRNKPGGLVVDYIGIVNELKKAFKIYADAKGKGNPAQRAEEAYAILLEKIDLIRGLLATFQGGRRFKYDEFEGKPHLLLIPIANHIFSLDDGKKRFWDAVLAATKAFALCGTLDNAKLLSNELAFYTAIKVVIGKFTTVDKKRLLAEKNSALKQILDNALIAQGVDDIFSLAGLQKPDISLLSDDFWDDIRKMPYRNLAIELLEKLLNDSIRSKMRNNVVQEKKYADRLQETLRRYNNRGIETAKVIEELILMAKEYQIDIYRESNLGLNQDEIAFYDALANNESAVRKLGEENLKLLAVEVTEKLRNSTTVDWQVRESVRAKLRILIKRTLQKYKYPPDLSPQAIELVIKQAEVLSNHWSSSMY